MSKPVSYETMQHLDQVLALIEQGNIEVATQYIRDVLGGVVGKPFDDGMEYAGAFERDFKGACRRNNIVAAFLAVKQLSSTDHRLKGLVHIGGYTIPAMVLSHHLQPLKEEHGIPVNPDKSYLKTLGMKISDPAKEGE